MTVLAIVCLVALSGCAVLGEQIAGIKPGLRAAAAALSPQVYEEQQTHRLVAANPNMSISSTNCRSNRDGSVTCTIIGQ